MVITYMISHGGFPLKIPMDKSFTVFIEDYNFYELLCGFLMNSLLDLIYNKLYGMLLKLINCYCIGIIFNLNHLNDPQRTLFPVASNFLRHAYNRKIFYARSSNS